MLTTHPRGRQRTVPPSAKNRIVLDRIVSDLASRAGVLPAKLYLYIQMSPDGPMKALEQLDNAVLQGERLLRDLALQKQRIAENQANAHRQSLFAILPVELAQVCLKHSEERYKDLFLDSFTLPSVPPSYQPRLASLSTASSSATLVGPGSAQRFGSISGSRSHSTESQASLSSSASNHSSVPFSFTLSPIPSEERVSGTESPTTTPADSDSEDGSESSAETSYCEGVVVEAFERKMGSSATMTMEKVDDPKIDETHSIRIDLVDSPLSFPANPGTPPQRNLKRSNPLTLTIPPFTTRNSTSKNPETPPKMFPVTHLPRVALSLSTATSPTPPPSPISAAFLLRREESELAVDKQRSSTEDREKKNGKRVRSSDGLKRDVMVKKENKEKDKSKAVSIEMKAVRPPVRRRPSTSGSISPSTSRTQSSAAAVTRTRRRSASLSFPHTSTSTTITPPRARSTSQSQSQSQPTSPTNTRFPRHHGQIHQHLHPLPTPLSLPSPSTFSRTISPTKRKIPTPMRLPAPPRSPSSSTAPAPVPYSYVPTPSFDSFGSGLPSGTGSGSGSPFDGFEYDYEDSDVDAGGGGGSLAYYHRIQAIQEREKERRNPNGVQCSVVYSQKRTSPSPSPSPTFPSSSWKSRGYPRSSLSLFEEDVPQPTPRIRMCGDPTFWRRLALRNASREMCGVRIVSSISSTPGTHSLSNSRKTKGTLGVVLGWPTTLIPLQRSMSESSGEVKMSMTMPMERHSSFASYSGIKSLTSSEKDYISPPSSPLPLSPLSASPLSPPSSLSSTIHNIGMEIAPNPLLTLSRRKTLSRSLKGREGYLIRRSIFEEERVLRRVMCEPVVVKGGRGRAEGTLCHSGVGGNEGGGLGGDGGGNEGGEEEEELTVEEGRVISVCWEGIGRSGLIFSWSG